MADSQVPWGVEALNGTTDRAGLATQAELVPDRRRHDPAPPRSEPCRARTGATVAEAAGSHAIYVSQPAATADLVKRAAQSARVETAQAV
jgi:hypothetical protein